jgi:hypothetical protein
MVVGRLATMANEQLDDFLAVAGLKGLLPLSVDQRTDPELFATAETRRKFFDAELERFRSFSGQHQHVHVQHCELCGTAPSGKMLASLLDSKDEAERWLRNHQAHCHFECRLCKREFDLRKPEDPIRATIKYRFESMSAHMTHMADQHQGQAPLR